MALSEKKKQKKLAKKKQKRKVHAKALTAKKVSMNKTTTYADFQIHECLMPNNLFESGIGTIIVARRSPDGGIALGAFIVDVFCLGVKNALFKVTSEYEYENTVKPLLMEDHGNTQFETILPSCAKSLVEGAVEYAKNLGFSSHPDYKDAKQILGDIDSSACPVKYSYGQDGKPFYMRGPHEPIHEAEQIIAKLTKACGEDGFEYVVMINE